MTSAEDSRFESAHDVARLDSDGPEPPFLYTAPAYGPEYYVGVSDLRPVGRPKRMPHGTRFYFESLLDDGEVRALAVSLPNVHNQKTDTLTVHTGAWCTSLAAGHNLKTDDRLAEIGLPNLYLAAAGEAAPGRLLAQLGRVALHPHQLLHELKQIELARTAEIMHGILDILPIYIDGADIRADNVAIIGESHGAMTGLGMVAQAESHGRTVETAQLVASCYIDKISHRDAARTIRTQLPAELKAACNVARHLTASELKREIATFTLNPITALHHAATWSTLRSGQPRGFIHAIPKDQHMGITAFEDDHSGQPELLQDAFTDFQNVTFRRRPGAHMTIAHPDVQAEIFDALKARLLA